MSSNVRFKVSKVEVDEAQGRVKQTIEALKPDNSVITTFTLDCGLQEASSLRRIKEQSMKKLGEYQTSVELAKALEEMKAKALAVEGKILGEKENNLEV